ncbi:MAG: hypothetical protein U1D35_15970 [Paracoccaceae bacterium]|nr:hypothetical protein [Paracoccaceae bacterium]
MTLLRPLLSLALALVLMATSVTMAVARGQAVSGTEMVICSGYGMVTIEVDAEGNPIGPVHACPDCLAGLMAALLPDRPQVHHPVRALRIWHDHGSAVLPSRGDVRVRARSPPLPV